MYFKINSVIQRFRLTEIIKYQKLYDVRTWPIGLKNEKDGPITRLNNELKHDDIFYHHHDEILSYWFSVTYGKLIGKYPRTAEEVNDNENGGKKMIKSHLITLFWKRLCIKEETLGIKEKTLDIQLSPREKYLLLQTGIFLIFVVMVVILIVAIINIKKEICVG